MSEINRIENEEKSKQTTAKKIDTSVFKSFGTIYQKLTPENKKAFWSRTVKAITVERDGSFKIEFL